MFPEMEAMEDDRSGGVKSFFSRGMYGCLGGLMGAPIGAPWSQMIDICLLDIYEVG